MAERFSFYDNDTGDIIQSGENGPIDGFPSASRAMASLDSTTSTLEGNDMFDIIRLDGKSIFGSTPDAKINLSEPIKFQTTSPCLGKPRILAPTHFYTKHGSYNEVKYEIDRSLGQRSELAFSTFPQNQMWKCKYLEGANIRELHLTCFYDTIKGDHLIEIKRVHGDGLFPKYPELLSVLKQAFGVADQSRPNAPSFLRSAPALPGRKNVITVEQFTSSLHSILNMGKESFLETRLESVKMIITMLEKKENLMILENNVDTCLIPVCEGLLLWLQDGFEEIVEFAVVCLSQIILNLSHNTAISSLLASFSEGKLVNCLLQQIRNDSVSYEEYLHIHRRRIASHALHTLITSHGNNQEVRKAIFQELQNMGFEVAQKWEVYVGHLHDEKLKLSAMTLTSVFNN